MSTDKKQKALEKIWREPPPRMALVLFGNAEKGDYFYIEQLGAWSPVPAKAVGTPIDGRLVARSKAAVREN